MLQDEEAASRVSKGGARPFAHGERGVAVRRRHVPCSADERECWREFVGPWDAVHVVHLRAGVVHEMRERHLIAPLCWAALRSP